VVEADAETVDEAVLVEECLRYPLNLQQTRPRQTTVVVLLC